MVAALACVAVAAAGAQTSALSESDRAEIQQLSEKYLRALNGPAPRESTPGCLRPARCSRSPSGCIEAREKLIELVRSERPCRS